MWNTSTTNGLWDAPLLLWNRCKFDHMLFTSIGSSFQTWVLLNHEWIDNQPWLHLTPCLNLQYRYKRKLPHFHNSPTVTWSRCATHCKTCLHSMTCIDVPVTNHKIVYPSRVSCISNTSYVQPMNLSLMVILLVHPWRAVRQPIATVDLTLERAVFLWTLRWWRYSYDVRLDPRLQSSYVQTKTCFVLTRKRAPWVHLRQESLRPSLSYLSCRRSIWYGHVKHFTRTQTVPRPRNTLWPAVVVFRQWFGTLKIESL